MDLAQWLTSGGALTALGLALATYLKTRPAMKAEQVKAEAALWLEINSLRAEQKLERKDCEERITRIEARHDKEMAEMKGEISILRHDRNNVRQGFNALLAMIKRHENSELSGIAETVEEMVARGDGPIAIEKATIRRTQS